MPGSLQTLGICFGMFSKRSSSETKHWKSGNRSWNRSWIRPQTLDPQKQVERTRLDKMLSTHSFTANFKPFSKKCCGPLSSISALKSPVTSTGSFPANSKMAWRQGSLNFCNLLGAKSNGRGYVSRKTIMNPTCFFFTQSEAASAWILPMPPMPVSPTPSPWSSHHGTWSPHHRHGCCCWPHTNECWSAKNVVGCANLRVSPKSYTWHPTLRWKENQHLNLANLSNRFMFLLKSFLHFFVFLQPSSSSEWIISKKISQNNLEPTPPLPLITPPCLVPQWPVASKSREPVLKILKRRGFTMIPGKIGSLGYSSWYPKNMTAKMVFSALQLKKESKNKNVTLRKVCSLFFFHLYNRTQMFKNLPLSLLFSTSGWSKICFFLEKSGSSNHFLQKLIKTSWCFNSSENYESNWIIFPSRGKHKKYLKPPPKRKGFEKCHQKPWKHRDTLSPFKLGSRLKVGSTF